MMVASSKKGNLIGEIRIRNKSPPRQTFTQTLKNHLIFTFDRHIGRKNHFQGNINSLSDLKKAIRSMDCVINIIGLSPLRKPTGTTYYEAHVRGVKNVLKVCKEFEIKRLVHMSILGANKKSTIEFTRTKGLGEELVMKSS
ncbi:NAD(P)H-binding protein, partial [candidate division KSB1 bacterium]|nr:NAD(P)H-binding protein [candidate division KSB1 bacterium]